MEIWEVVAPTGEPDSATRRNPAAHMAAAPATRVSRSRARYAGRGRSVMARQGSSPALVRPTTAGVLSNVPYTRLPGLAGSALHQSAGSLPGGIREVGKRPVSLTTEAPTRRENTRSGDPVAR